MNGRIGLNAGPAKVTKRAKVARGTTEGKRRKRYEQLEIQTHAAHMVERERDEKRGTVRRTNKYDHEVRTVKTFDK